jgi:hypothetical protein
MRQNEKSRPRNQVKNKDLLLARISSSAGWQEPCTTILMEVHNEFVGNAD